MIIAVPETFSPLVIEALYNQLVKDAVERKGPGREEETVQKKRRKA
jgi:hypothetical protein